MAGNMEIDMRVIAGNIQALRSNRGLARTEVARRAGISILTFRDWEAGCLSDGKISTLIAMADAMHAPPEALLQNCYTPTAVWIHKSGRR